MHGPEKERPREVRIGMVEVTRTMKSATVWILSLSICLSTNRISVPSSMPPQSMHITCSMKCC
ncbi:FLZ-type domain-containing protein [Psidium guajava]|nr:FLZ-type domain-containing protein [Psidium guajava]